jgi:Predicted membrane protein
VNEVLIDAQTTKPSLLVLTDVYFPGWRVTVDGKESKIVRTNGVFRGVQLDAGHHSVRFFFDPISLKIGFLMFLVGLGAIVFLLRPPKGSAKNTSQSGLTSV